MNRLGNETSLYLRQHADNPVHWQPWDENALREAREKDRPILLSIGYSACHWCHVMAHESFEDAATAEMMNRHFVNIKVDREERPDLDRIYQLAHQLLTGRGGGWPLTVFLDPQDQVPFFAGTYFPLERRYGMPSFREVLQALGQWYREHRDELGQQNGKLLEALNAINNSIPDKKTELSDSFAQELFSAAAAQMIARHDPVNGGFGGAPKFPQAPLLEATAAIGKLESRGRLSENLRFTLERMARSGLRDHLDGGFFRYCVDEHWTIPHFEKMLYDNAQLLPLYAEGAKRWSSPELKSAATGIADWLENAMAQPGGGYASSIDADAAGEEGGFHVWTPDEVSEVLEEPQLGHFIRHYGLDKPPNFEGRSWHLQYDQTVADAELQASLEDSRQKLWTVRAKRIHPALDKKRLASWNALLAGGLIRAGRALGRDDYPDRAESIFTFIREKLWTGKTLLAVYNEGAAKFPAYLDDYAWLLEALMDSLQLSWNRDRLEFAVQLAETLLERFEDQAHGGFFFSDAEVEVPMTRSMIFQDDATPSGNSAAINALNRLGRLLGEPRYTAAADRALQRGMPALRENPLAHASLLKAVREAVSPSPHLVISGQDEAQRTALKVWAEANYRLDCYLIGAPDAKLPGILSEYASGEAVTAWLCQGMHCLAPAHSQEELKLRLQESRR